MKIHNKELSSDQYIKLLIDLCHKISEINTETNGAGFYNDLKNDVLDGRIIFNTQILLNFNNKKNTWRLHCFTF